MLLLTECRILKACIVKGSEINSDTELLTVYCSYPSESLIVPSGRECALCLGKFKWTRVRENKCLPHRSVYSCTHEIILDLGQWGQEDQKFQVTPSYLLSSSPAWASWKEFLFMISATNTKMLRSKTKVCILSQVVCFSHPKQSPPTCS